MADFRRCIFAFAVVALLLGLVPTASAQSVAGVQCIANSAVPPTIRGEGLTELVGDIVLNCSGGTPTPAGQVIPQANITIFLNTQVTSRLYGTAPALSEAILTVDEPCAAAVCVLPGGGTSGPQTSAAQTCTSITGCPAFAAGPGNPGFGNQPNSLEFKTLGFTSTGATCTVGTAGCTLNPNVFQGQVNGNFVTFNGIPIDPPGTQSTRIYRVTNVRANAAVVQPGGSGTPGQIIALISATPATSPGGLTSTFSINNPQQIVGFTQTSLNPTFTAPTPSAVIQQCVGAGVAVRSASQGTLNFAEIFPTAFKTRTTAGPGIATQNTLGLVYNTESGYYNPALGGNLGLNGGLADFGTRLKAVFTNVPNGVNVFVTVNNTNPSATTSPTAGRFAVLTSSETGAFSAVSSTSISIGGLPASTVSGLFQVPIVNGTGVAVWEVVAADPLAIQTYSFGLFVTAAPSPTTNSPAVGVGSVALSYAPTPGQGAFAAGDGARASATLPIPRFIDTPATSQFVSVVLCRTNLLWPYVTNVAGFDTGIAIANTSTDPFGATGASPQNGTCALNFFGSNAPAVFTTPSVTSGTVYANLISSLAPNFTGYVIAQCNFQYAHGFAFISDVGARNLAMGYLALVIPDPPRSATPFECSAIGVTCTSSGEQLGF